MSWPDLPPSLPRRNSRFGRWLGRTLLGLAGWGVKDSLPDRPKLVVTGAPHTSNWDWVVAILTILALDLQVSWLGKHTMFEGPLGWLFRGLGGVPVDRTAGAGVVQQIVDEFDRHEQLIIALAPEGTRKRVTRFRSGFHRISRAAEVPFATAALDYENKLVHFGPIVELGDDVEADIDRLQAYYAQFRGQNPSNST